MWPQPNTVRAPRSHQSSQGKEAGECGRTGRDLHHALRIEKPGLSQAQPGPDVLLFLIQELNVLSKVSGLNSTIHRIVSLSLSRRREADGPRFLHSLKAELLSVSSGDSLTRGAE